MSFEELIQRADEILRKRTGVSIHDCAGYNENSIREKWSKSDSQDFTSLEDEASHIAEDLTYFIYHEYVDEFLMASIGFKLEDFPNPNDEMMDNLVTSDLDWDNLDQYGPENFREDAKNVAETWVAGCWDDETGTFK